jgi:hypothetical protein
MRINFFEVCRKLVEGLSVGVSTVLGPGSSVENHPGFSSVCICALDPLYFTKRNSPLL